MSGYDPSEADRLKSAREAIEAHAQMMGVAEIENAAKSDVSVPLLGTQYLLSSAQWEQYQKLKALRDKRTSILNVAVSLRTKKQRRWLLASEIIAKPMNMGMDVEGRPIIV